MSGVWNVPAVERVAALRESADRSRAAGFGPAKDDASDLEVLNQAYESAVRAQIDARDAYMRLLSELRQHDDKVRAGAVAGVRPHIDRIARHVVRQHLTPAENLLYRIAHLSGALSGEGVASLRSAAERVRHTLGEEAPAEERLDPGDAREHLSRLRSVVTILLDRKDVTAADTLRLMDAALNDGPLLDLFTVGTPEPTPRAPTPAFSGPGWAEHALTWTYQPDPAQGFVTAVAVGDQWWINLWAASGPLLAQGTAGEDQVGALAQALVEHAPAWSVDRSEYAWRRFADTTAALRPPPSPTARVQAATARSASPEPGAAGHAPPLPATAVHNYGAARSR
jgi:hypothetical protein